MKSMLFAHGNIRQTTYLLLTNRPSLLEFKALNLHIAQYDESLKKIDFQPQKLLLASHARSQ